MHRRKEEKRKGVLELSAQHKSSEGGKHGALLVGKGRHVKRVGRHRGGAGRGDGGGSSSIAEGEVVALDVDVETDKNAGQNHVPEHHERAGARCDEIRVLKLLQKGM